MAPPSTKQRLLIILAAVVGIAVAVLRIVGGMGGPTLSPVVMEGAPVRATVGGRDALWVLTTHWETSRSGGGGRFNTSVTRTSRMHTDLWRFDATTGALDWRSRLLTERGGTRMGFRVYGIAGGKLWLWARGLRAVALDDGRPLADSGTFLSAAPALRGTWPRSADQVRLDPAGLMVLAADARVWRIDPATFEVSEARAGGEWQDAYTEQFTKRDTLADARAGVVRPGITYPSSTTAFLLNNLWEPGRWTGLLVDARGDALRAPLAAGGPGAIEADRYMIRDLVFDYHFAPRERPRLWRARVVIAPGGTRRWRDLAPLPRSEGYLGGGLLHDARVAPDSMRAIPLRLADPAGVLVLHRARLDDADTLRLARVDLADGATRWTATLPMTLLQSVLPGTRTLALYGRRATTRAESAVPTDAASDVVVLVELATGRVRSFDMDVDGRAALLAAR
jgi:hypothetical protein